MIVVRAALHESVDLYVLVAASGIMFALVLMRLAGIVRHNEELAVQRVALTEQGANRRSEARLSSLIKNSSDVICVVGPAPRSTTSARRSSRPSATTPSR